MVHRMMPSSPRPPASPSNANRWSAPLAPASAGLRDHKFDEICRRRTGGRAVSLRLFGLIPDSLELRPDDDRSPDEQIAGYYDPIPTRCSSRDIERSAARRGIARAGHALQDQYVHLDSIITQRHANDRAPRAGDSRGSGTVAQIPVLMPSRTRHLRAGMFWRQRAVMAAQQAQNEGIRPRATVLREDSSSLSGWRRLIVWFGTNTSVSRCWIRCPSPRSRSCIRALRGARRATISPLVRRAGHGAVRRRLGESKRDSYSAAPRQRSRSRDARTGWERRPLSVLGRRVTR